jgi:hypothetical protein
VAEQALGPGRRVKGDDFVAAAQETARGSIANEPGSQRFEVIADAKTLTSST